MPIDILHKLYIISSPWCIRCLAPVAMAHDRCHLETEDTPYQMERLTGAEVEVAARPVR